MIIHCSKLTACRTLDDGETIKLEFLDQRRNPISLLLSFENAESIVMTLPRLLTRAVRAQTGKDNSRYVFDLGQWLLEGVQDHQSLILTLTTIDGFEVSFRIPDATCRALGWSLQHDTDDDTPDLRDSLGAVGKPEIN
jgi:Rad3-related DNA helicase